MLENYEPGMENENRDAFVSNARDRIIGNTFRYLGLQ
jgi:hypothetical protein